MFDQNAVFCPPKSLQYTQQQSIDSQKLNKESNSSSIATSSEDDDEEDKSFRPSVLYDSEAKQKESLSSEGSMASQHTVVPRSMSPSTSVEKQTSSGTSTPTLSRTISISSVFSRSQSQHRDSISTIGSSFFDKFTSEAKEVAREAKAVGKSALDATKPAAAVGKQKFFKNLQVISEPSLKKDERDSSSSASSLISSVSSDFNGFADKTAGMISGFLSSKASGFASKMKEKAQPFGPFPKGNQWLFMI